MSLRVLHVIGSLGQGGAENVLYRLIGQSSGIEHEVVSLAGLDVYGPRLKALGIRVDHLESHSVWSLVPTLWRLRAIIRERRPDVVQCWMYRANLFGGVVGKLCGVPVIWNVRCTTGAEIGRMSHLLARTTAMVSHSVPDVILNCSARSAEEHVALGYPADVTIVPNGFDPKVLVPDDESRRRIRQELGLRPDEFLMASITRWVPYKDIPGLLTALRLAADQGATAKCLLIGTDLGTDNPELMEAIRQSGCTDFVVPLGKRSDIPELARAADLHVLASRGGEGFSNAISETMLSGVPNVATDVGDAGLIMDDSGWVVPPSDPPAFADAIVQAYREWKDEPEQWIKRRSRARQRIAERFTLDRMVSTYENLWATIARQAQDTPVSAK